MNAPECAARSPGAPVPEDEKFRWNANAGFLFIHFVGILGPIAVWYFIGLNWKAFLIAFVLYVVRMFFVTGVRHRYFSHRSYETSRVMQFIFGFIATGDGMQGPLWWAAHHRAHHVHSDEEDDVHSAKQKGMWWSHVGWITCTKYTGIDWKRVRDLAKFPELVWLEGRPQVYLGLVLLGTSCLFFGWCFWDIQEGLRMLVVGFFTSTVIVYHATFCINSLAHKIGKKRADNKDESRNSWILAFLTMGEGWHADHHHKKARVKQGDEWWKIDITYYILWMMALVRIIRFRKEVG